MTYLWAAGAGLTAGTHVATWGMYKDSPHEGFWPRRYVRSILLALVAALALAAGTGVDLSNPRDLAPFFGVVYAVERLATELLKYVLREDEQDKYAIPMRMAAGGKVVDRRTVRYSIGALLVLVTAAGVAAVHAAEVHLPGAPGWAVVAVIGSSGGWVTSLGGAWKDAPIEGFSLLKFPRSPLIALAWAIPIAMLTTDWLFIAIGAAGYAVATIETYKKFWAPHRPPGKFAGHPIRYPEAFRLRRWFAPVYAALWVLILANLALALSLPHHGLLG